MLHRPFRASLGGPDRRFPTGPDHPAWEEGLQLSDDHVPDTPNARIVYIKGTPATMIGYVEAPDERTEIKKEIEEFKIEPGIQGRLVADRWG